MKTIQAITLSAFTLLILVGSCKKDKEPTPNPPGQSGTILDFFCTYGEQAQSFTIDADSYSQIIGSKGTKVGFYPNSLVDQSGNSVTGNVHIELIEIYTKRGMVMSNKPTTSSGNLLVSGGEINIVATQNGSKLNLAPASNVVIQMPTSNPISGMQVFYGSIDLVDGLNWTLADSSSSSVSIVTDSLVTDPSMPYFYYFLSTSLDWINCDYFYNDPNPRTSITISTPKGYDQSSTKVFIVLNDYNSIAQTYWDGSNFSQPNTLHEGLNTTVAAIAEIDGIYYSAFSPEIITTNHEATLTFSETTVQAFESAVDAL